MESSNLRSSTPWVSLASNMVIRRLAIEGQVLAKKLL